MPYNYKDLTYIRAALQNYEASLCRVNEDECEENEFSEIQDDIMYISRLISLTEREINVWDSKGPSIRGVPNKDENA